MDEDGCGDQGRHTRHRRHQQAFRQQLTDDARATGAERSAHGQLAPSRHRPRQLQVAEIGAGDQEDREHACHDHRERGRRLGVPGLVEHRRSREAHAASGATGHKPGQHELERRYRSPPRRRIGEASDKSHTAVVGIREEFAVELPVWHQLRIRGQRYPHRRCPRHRRVGGARSRHPDDLERHVVQPDGLPEYIGGPTEAIAPESVADDGHRHGRRQIIIVEAQSASERHRHAQRVEIVAAHDSRRNGSIDPVEAEALHAFGDGHQIDGGHLIVQEPVLRRRRARPPSPMCLPEHDDDLIRIGQRPRTEEHAVGDAEDAGVETHAERERDQGRERERRRLAQAAGGVAEVGRCVLQPTEPSRVVRVFPPAHGLPLPGACRRPPPAGRGRLRRRTRRHGSASWRHRIRRSADAASRAPAAARLTVARRCVGEARGGKAHRHGRTASRVAVLRPGARSRPACRAAMPGMRGL
jgi:hypothetical protein